jgi:hypothetical protein
VAQVCAIAHDPEMRLALAIALALATTAAADPKPTTETKQACKRKVMGKGLDRKVVCVFEEPIVIAASAPKPKVVIAPADGRKVVGRPKSADPLVGLDRRRAYNE